MYSIQVFDHIVVNIVGQQSKYHLADVKLSFVGLAPNGGLADGDGSRHHRRGDVPPSRGKKPGKNTLGSLRTAIEDEQDAKAQRVAEAQENMLNKLRQKAGMLPADEHGRKGRKKRAQKRGNAAGPSLYARLNGANVPSGHTTSETASLQISAESVRSGTNSMPMLRETLGAGDVSALIATGYPEESAGRRKLGGAVAVDEVVPLRELDASSVSVRASASASAVSAVPHWNTASSSNSNKHVAKGPVAGQGFTMRRTVLSAPRSPVEIQANHEATSEPEPAVLPVSNTAFEPAAPEQSPDTDAPAAKSKDSARSASGSSSGSSDGSSDGSSSEEDLEAFLDSVLD